MQRSWDFPVSDSKTSTLTLAFLGPGSRNPGPQALPGREQGGRAEEEGPGAPAPSEPLHLCPGLHGEPGLPFRACQSNPAAWKFKRGQKEADFKTHLCLPLFPSPPPHGCCSRLPGGSLAPGLSQAELKPEGSGAEAGGGLWGGSGRHQPWSHARLGAAPGGWRRNLRQIRGQSCPFFSEEGVAGERGLTLKISESGVCCFYLLLHPCTSTSLGF